MDLMEIDLRREVNDLIDRSSIAFLFERDQMFLYFGFHSFPGDDKPIVLDGEFEALFLDSSQRE